MSDELKRIKNIYGEEMMHLCREEFPTLLEEKGFLLNILTQHIAPTRELANLINEGGLRNEFILWVYKYVRNEKEDLVNTDKTPFELMKEAGYTLYECHNEDEIQKFREYYRGDETLCTFTQGGRYKRCFVFFAVRDDVDTIKREDFSNPKREDDYSLSVLSIQISRINHMVSIKSRYNHTVNQPDAVYENRLEKIIPGLTMSFGKYLKLRIISDVASEDFFEDMGYILANDGKYYRELLKMGNISYCENNIIIDNGNVVDQYAKNPERYIVIDEFILDLKMKKFFQYDNNQPNSFIDSITCLGEIKIINVVKSQKDRIITIKYEDGKEVILRINHQNSLISYENNYIKEIDDYFLSNSKYIEHISLANARVLGNNFLKIADNLKGAFLPETVVVGDGFMKSSWALKKLSMPKLEIIGDHFLSSSHSLVELNLPSVKRIGHDFMCWSHSSLLELNLPNVISVGDGFLANACWSNLRLLSMPKLESIGSEFGFSYIGRLKSLFLPSVIEIGNNFLYRNEGIEEVALPKVKKVGMSFMYACGCIQKLSMPTVESIGEYFLDNVKTLEELEINNPVEERGLNYLTKNKKQFNIELADDLSRGYRWKK